MVQTPSIIYTTINHKRFHPKEHKFTYKHYYLSIPLSELKNKSLDKFIKHNKRGLISFYDIDHIKKTSDYIQANDIHEWAYKILKTKNIDHLITDITLITMPRIFGYIFNPASFWFCYDKNEQLIAVITEVNNTFGEGHVYLCYKQDFSTITDKDELTAKKVFHVSPFFERDGIYKFRFIQNDRQIMCFINYFNNNGERLLTASLLGHTKPLTKSKLVLASIRYPLITLKTTFFIHWQALILYFKGIKFFTLPAQDKTKLTYASEKGERLNKSSNKKHNED